MLSEVSQLQRCKKFIENKLDWGSSQNWQTLDFENLSQLILDSTGVSLSISTLRRIWGRVEYNHLPSSTTLNTLARFAGYEDWRNFVKSDKMVGPEPAVVVVKRGYRLSFNKLTWITLLGIAVLMISVFAFNHQRSEPKNAVYHFASQQVTRGIPNSVIFTYDASASPTDSVFIQQSWDNRKRTLVSKDLHKHTSIYYEPGVYMAKLLVGSQIVKEHRLVIPTNDWVATIDQEKIPVYLKKEEFLQRDRLYIPIEVIKRKNIDLQPQPPLVKFFNVGNFDPVPLKDFAFSADVKNEFTEGAGICQFTYIGLVTDDIPITIPLSAKGCVSELNVRSVDDFVSGKQADLSALGVDFSNWVKVSCRAANGKIRYFINEKQALEFDLPKRNINVIGVAYGFRGTGSVRHIEVVSGDITVFSELLKKPR